jgi:Flp pilus assembly protein TadB
VAPVGSVSKKILPPVLSGVVVVAAVVAVAVAVVVVVAADVIPVWTSRNRKARQTKKGNCFMPVLPER